MCVTQDPHDKENPYKKVPKREYIRYLAEIFKHEDRILIEKSRQMMFSWVICLLLMWDVLNNKSRHWFIISKKEEDADKMLDRIDFTYKRLPGEYHDPKYRRKYCEINLPGNDGRIMAVSQNSDAMRSYVASGVFCDESEFQDNFKQVYEAIRPTIDGGGRLIGVSTVNGKGPVYKLMNDELDF